MCLTGIDSRSPGAQSAVNGIARALDLEVDLAADEAQADVRQQRARQEAGLAQHLKAVADPEHEPALA